MVLFILGQKRKMHHMRQGTKTHNEAKQRMQIILMQIKE